MSAAQWWQQAGQHEVAMRDIWYFYYCQAKAEGCNDDDAARMADRNAADHVADEIDRWNDERKDTEK